MDKWPWGGGRCRDPTCEQHGGSASAARWPPQTSPSVRHTLRLAAHFVSPAEVTQESQLKKKSVKKM